MVSNVVSIRNIRKQHFIPWFSCPAGQEVTALATYQCSQGLIPSISSWDGMLSPEQTDGFSSGFSPQEDQRNVKYALVLPGNDTLILKFFVLSLYLSSLSAAVSELVHRLQYKLLPMNMLICLYIKPINQYEEFVGVFLDYFCNKYKLSTVL